MNSQKQICSHSNGFSLLELIIVIMIIAIVSAISIPKSTQIIYDMRLKAAGDKLLDDLRYIHSYAVARHDTTWLVVYPNDNSYGIYVGPSTAQRELILDPTTNAQSLVYFNIAYKGVNISTVNFGGSNEFYFNWWGTPSTGGQVVLNNIKTINVSPGTGYVYETQ